MTMSTSSSTPYAIFLQIAKKIENDILSGTLKEGEPAPSANELAQAFCVNRNTASKALSALSRREILYKRRGIGMFVMPGAGEKILKRRREEFASFYLEPMLAEAELLGISKSYLINFFGEDKKQAAEKIRCL